MAMAIGQIQIRYSRFILNALTYLPTPKIGVPIQQFSSKPSPILKKRAYDEEEGWFHSPKGVGFTLLFFSLGAGVAISSGKWVTVPYTERSHLVLFYKFLARFQTEEFMEFEGEPVLPPLHPASITAQRIFQDIIDRALPLETEIKRGLEKESKLGIEVSHQEKKSLNMKILFKFRTREDFDKKQDEAETCEITVVDSPEAAVASGGRFGKVYVTTTLLHHYRNHEEMIATVLAHEVGHDLARHVEENISKWISTVSVIGTSLYLFCQSTYIRSKLMSYPVVEKLMRPHFLPSVSFFASVGLLSYIIMMKYSRGMIMEADYIGLMLASSAGYNPRVGRLYPVSGIEFGESVLPEFLSAVPSGKKRSQYLSDPQVLNEAISRYREKPPVSTAAPR